MQDILLQMKKARGKAKISQKKFGEALGWPQSHISSIEHGKTDPRLSSVIQMARALNLELMLVPRPMVMTVESIRDGKEGSEFPLWNIVPAKDQLEERLLDGDEEQPDL